MFTFDESISNIVKRGFLYFVVSLCIILYLVVKIQEDCIPINSVIYRDFNIQQGVLTGIDNHLVENVKEMFIVKTSIYYTLVPAFGKYYFCHWAILTKTDKNNLILISPTGNGGVDVHEVLDSYIYKEGNETFIYGGSLKKHIIFNEQTYVPSYKISVNDVINEMLKVNKSVKYLALSMNCHYVVEYVLSTFTNSDTPKVSTLTSFKRVFKDFLTGHKYTLNK